MTTTNVLDSAPISRIGYLIETAGFTRTVLRTLPARNGQPGEVLEVFAAPDGKTTVKTFSSGPLDGGLPDA